MAIHLPYALSVQDSEAREHGSGADPHRSNDYRMSAGIEVRDRVRAQHGANRIGFEGRHSGRSRSRRLPRAMRKEPNHA